jgi:hypothetical protein
MVLKITSVLVSSKKRTEARCKDSVNIMVNYIRKALYFNKMKVGFL